LSNETPAQRKEQAFNVCKVLLHFFSVKGGTPIFDNKSTSNSAQNGTLDSKIKCLCLAFFQATPPEAPCTWGTTNNKPPGPIIMINQLEILSLSQIQFIALVFAVAQLCCTFYQPRQGGRIWWGKTNFLS